MNPRYEREFDKEKIARKLAGPLTQSDMLDPDWCQDVLGLSLLQSSLVSRCNDGATAPNLLDENVTL